MSSATLKPLRELLDVQSGFAFKKENFSESRGIPLIRIRDLENDATETMYDGPFREEFLVEPGDYLIGMDGEFHCHIWRGPQALLNQRVCRIRNFRPEVEPQYIYYGIQKYLKDIEEHTPFATVKHISGRQIENIVMPVPDLEGQRDAVDVLSRAENVVRMRREAEQKAKEIIPALFLDMFGDPGTNSKGWGIESLAEVAAIESPLRTPNFVTEATEVCIGPDSIESMTGQLLSQPTVGDIRPISGKYRYRCRDVLYSKIRPALVKVALAPSDGYCSADMYPLRCGPKLQPEYLMQILLNRHFTRYALDRATRAQMPKINREALFAFRLPVPPIDLQESFARHCQGYMRVREQQRTAMGTAELAFQSLLARVFGE